MVHQHEDVEFHNKGLNDTSISLTVFFYSGVFYYLLFSIYVWNILLQNHFVHNGFLYYNIDPTDDEKLSHQYSSFTQKKIKD